MTERARAEACRQVGGQNRSVACVARDFGASLVDGHDRRLRLGPAARR